MKVREQKWRLGKYSRSRRDRGVELQAKKFAKAKTYLALDRSDLTSVAAKSDRSTLLMCE